MIRSRSVKLAVSGLVIASSVVACNPGAHAFRPVGPSANAPKAEQEAIRAYAKANAALQKGDRETALREAERAVALSPRDIGYRMLLADLYLKGGRFQSAETTFGDVLALDPGNERAQLSIALAQIALGRTSSALVRLDRLGETAAPGDIGLAYALAGQPQRAIELLEPAARAPDANARVRQNLALAYALAGDWQKARVTAAQDVSPAQLGDRMAHWAALARPQASWDQVAALLNVTPAQDPGQPARLALAPAAPAQEAYAAAVPAPAPVAAPAPTDADASGLTATDFPAPPPVTVASLAGAPAPIAPIEAKLPETAALPDWVPAEAAPQPAEESRPLYAAAVQELVAPQNPVIRASAPAVSATEPRFERPRAKPAVAAPREPAAPGKFAVQLGAFSSPAGVERAWAQSYKRYGFVGRTPYSTTVTLPKGKFHRLSVAGYESYADASRVCRSIKAKGGACFVRAVAGDAPVQWAGRYTGKSA